MDMFDSLFDPTESITLSQMCSLIKAGIEAGAPGQYLVKAEIASITQRSGHCYLELVEQGPKGISAKCRATIWASRWIWVATKFETLTGSQIKVGIEIQVLASASYSPIYGLSLNITDISPEATLGEMEARRRKALKTLEEEGLISRQRDLPTPQLPYRLAVISSAGAAGWGDFIRHLEDNSYGFRFDPHLIEATMQGKDCPQSIINALGTAQDDDFDLALILRGGGSALDLSCFDDLELGRAIARSCIPVLCAVGHDRDHHVCDEVAHISVKTPTALADFVISLYEDEDARLESLEGRLRMALAARLSKMEAQVELLAAKIAAADPRNILSRGFILATDSEGKVLKSAAEVRQGMRMSILFADGSVSVEVIEKELR